MHSHQKDPHHASMHSSEGPRKASADLNAATLTPRAQQNHKAHRPTVTAKSIEHLWVMVRPQKAKMSGNPRYSCDWIPKQN